MLSIFFMVFECKFLVYFVDLTFLFVFFCRRNSFSEQLMELLPFPGPFLYHCVFIVPFFIVPCLEYNNVYQFWRFSVFSKNFV